MPFKARDAQLHKFPNTKYRVTNWREYNEYLRLRGDICIWFDPDLLSDRRASGPRQPDGKRLYSDLAIELCLTQGMIRSLFRLNDLPLPVPDFSTLSRRGRLLDIQQDTFKPGASITLIVDSTGLRIHSRRDWM